jgi:hypothetical protein
LPRATFTPGNSLETKLRTLLADLNTLTRSFYTPLAAAPLWVIVQNQPELDGCDLVVSQNKRRIALLCDRCALKLKHEQ